MADSAPPLAAPIARKVLDAYLLGIDPADSKKPADPAPEVTVAPATGAQL